MSTYTEDTRSILQEKKSSAVVVILQPLCVFYLLPILDNFWLAVYVAIIWSKASVLVRLRERSE